ncbi:MAG: hypothetical protein DWQ37_05125 [Planctomycetota bacterium]|nr:MAG: hypothetical protein DWQ37_05125 [Planctomycetota bacterium]
MPKVKEPLNPFYVLVVLLGVVFVVTTCAYGTMAYRAVAQTEEGPGLMSMVDRYGVQSMGVELVLLGGATFGAMWLDGYRLRKRSGSEANQPADE